MSISTQSGARRLDRYVSLKYYKVENQWVYFACSRSEISLNVVAHEKVTVYMGRSTETVGFQVYEILKSNHEFLQFF